MLSTAEAAKYLGLSATHVALLCRSGVIPSYRFAPERGVGGRARYRIRVRDLEKWIESRRHIPLELKPTKQSPDDDWDAAVRHVLKGRG
jgi:excisionase family DNA binding protein